MKRKTIQNTGAGLFIISIIIFASCLFLNKYKLTNEILQRTVTNPSHFEVLQPKLKSMTGVTFKSKKPFIKQFNSAIKKINEQYRQNKAWDKVIYKDYTYPAIKKSSTGIVKNHQKLFFYLTFVLGIVGALIYILPKFRKGTPGIKHNNIFFSKLLNRGWSGISLGVLLIGFYILLYWYPAYISEWISLVDPVSIALSGNEASQWFLYGFLYTLAVLVMGVRMFAKYRHSIHHRIRTASVMFFQASFAYIIPEILVSLNQPYKDLKNIWPLDHDFFYGWNIDQFIQSGSFGMFILVWGTLLAVIGVPLFTYFLGKRWYCSWVCGCGGLAETLGDPWRHLSNKGKRAWKIERWLVHSIFLIITIITTITLVNYFIGFAFLGKLTAPLHKWYGFAIASVFAGVIGVGFYPWMGNRVWCRFGCPLAAYLGIIQRFKSRFRITTNGGQCMSCGNCSTYCEMGIDVRWYAQRGQNIVRASCVGCGVCSAVCPRGVLRLENKSEKGRINGNPHLHGNNTIVGS
jgi:Pyruvate/2-oxoacid:ferredoxin oxidoreductase delta subunit